MALSRVHRTAGQSRRSLAQGMFNVLVGCARKGPRSGWSQPSNRRREEAAEAPSAHQPQGEGVRRSGSAAPRVRMRGRSYWPGFLVLSGTSWANGDSDTDNAPHRTGRRRSRARPRFRITQRAGAYPRGPPPGEQGSIPKQRTGSGMDPPVFWAGNTGKSQTTHSIIHEPMSQRNPKTHLSAPCRPKCSQPGRNGVAGTEWPFRPRPRQPTCATNPG